MFIGMSFLVDSRVRADLFIAVDIFDVKPHPLQARLQLPSFTLQFNNVKVGHQVVEIVNIYRAPSSSNLTFFKSLMTMSGPSCCRLQLLNDLWLIKSFMPQCFVCQRRISRLAGSARLKQHVGAPRHYLTANRRENILDFVIMSDV